MKNLLYPLILFALLFTFGILFPNIFVFLFFLVLLMLSEFDRRQAEAKLRHKQLMRGLGLIANGKPYRRREKLKDSA